MPSPWCQQDAAAPYNSSAPSCPGNCQNPPKPTSCPVASRAIHGAFPWDDLVVPQEAPHLGVRPERMQRIDIVRSHGLEHEPLSYDPCRRMTSRTASVPTSSSIFGGDAAPASINASTAPA